MLQAPTNRLESNARETHEYRLRVHTGEELQVLARLAYGVLTLRELRKHKGVSKRGRGSGGGEAHSRYHSSCTRS